MPGTTNAPYKMVTRAGKHYVVNNSGQTKGGPYDDPKDADKLLKALYANVPGAAAKAAKTKWTGSAPIQKAASFIGAEDRRKMGASGVAMPDGSFPIPDRAHLESAIHLARSDAQRRHVTARAKALGVTSMIPTGWTASGDRQASSTMDITPALSAQDVMEMPDMQQCPMCMGDGHNPPGSNFDCPMCDATGYVPKPETAAGRTFALDAPNGSVLLTGPVASVIREIAAVNSGFMHIVGRYVEADRPNRNMAMWSTKDLEMGQPTVTGGPLNWLHKERHIIGAITGSRMVRQEAGSVGNHIQASAVVWPFLYPNEARAIEKASSQRTLWLSMECTSSHVQCMDTPGRAGCGVTVPYREAMTGGGCDHLRQKSSVRRFVNPSFLGGAVVLPPAQPGWAHAEANVLRQAAMAVEEQEIGTDVLNTSDAREMVAAILAWAS